MRGPSRRQIPRPQWGWWGCFFQSKIARLLQRDETFFRDDLLAVLGEDPIDKLLGLPGRIAGGVKVKLAGDRVLPGARRFRSRFDSRLSFFGRDFEPADRW